MEKRILLITAFLLLSASSLFSQFVYKIKADSVLITNDSCTAELNLENSTKNVQGGFLYNKGKGRTEFRKALIKLNDSLYVIGTDTLNLMSGNKNIYNSDGRLSSSRILHGNMETLQFDSLNFFEVNVVGNVAYYPTWNSLFMDTDAGVQLHRAVIFPGDRYRISSLALGENSASLQTGNQNDTTSGLATNFDNLSFFPFEGKMLISELAPAANMTNKAVMVWDSSSTAWQRIAASAFASATPLSSLTAAAAANTINNANYTQQWQWNSLGNGSGLSLTSTSTAAASNNQKLLNVALSGANATSSQATYAGYFSNTHTGTASGNVGVAAVASGGDTNYGIFASASGGSSNNTAGYFVGAAGSPIIRLEQPTNTSHAAMIFNLSGLSSWSVGSRGTTSEFCFNNSNYFSGLDILKLSHSLGCVGVGGVSSISARLHITAGSASAGLAPLKFTQGTNLTTPESGAVEFDGTNYFVSTSTARYTLAKTLTNTASLNFASTSAGTSTDLTITVTGAVDGDAVNLGVPNTAVNSNSSYSAWVSASNTVTVRFNNYSSGSIDPASATFRVSVTKY